MSKTKWQLFRLFIYLLKPLVNQDGKGGGGGGGTSTTTTQPWAGQQPYLTDVMKQAKGLYYGGYEKPIYTYPTVATTPFVGSEGFGIGRGSHSSKITGKITGPIQTGTEWIEGPGGKLEYYPGQAIAGFTPLQKAAQTLATQRAGELTPVFESTAGIATTAPTIPDYLQRTLSGERLSPDTNPWLSSYVQRAKEEAVPGIDTTAIEAGRYGSEAWGAERGRAEADIVSQIYGGAYESERARQAAAEQFAPQYLQAGQQLQLQAAGMAPELARQDIGMLSAVGEEQQAMEQALLDEIRRKYEFEQMEPWQRLAMYSGLVSGDLGGETIATQSGGGGK